MIVQLTGEPADLDAGRAEIEELVRSWGHDAVRAGETAGPSVVDPISVAALILSIPGAALALLQLVDRFTARRRAQELIDRAAALAERDVTLRVLSGDTAVDVRTLTPDELLALPAA